jgi:hypothetical protein
MKNFIFRPLVVAAATTMLLWACSSSDDNALDGAGGASGSSGSGGSSGHNGSGGSGGKDPGIGFGGSPSSTDLDPDAACGAAEAEAEPIPVFMVFVYDKSASMGVNTYVDSEGKTQTIDNTELRWKPVKNGVVDFFTNAGTSNVRASIAFFAAPGDKVTTCAHDYSVPDVPMTPLETPTALIKALDNQVPSGGTPTLPAVIGGIKYAKRLVTENPGSEAIVVLVTDGEPAIYNAATGKTETDCAPTGVSLLNTIEDIATYVGGAANGTPSIKTHVIGLGDTTSIGKMKSVSEAAGTAFIQVDPTDATTTRTAILTQLKAIQPKAITCKVAIPSTKEGFDSGEVNVNFVHGGGSVEELSRSDDCVKPGWRYDNAATPKFIELCPTTCDTIQKDLEGKLKILLGCPTRVIL